MKTLKFFTAFFMLFSSVANAVEPLVYVVKNGDTLSHIAQAKIGSPVYPKNSGSLAKLLKLNPNLNKNSVIYSGQALIYGFSNIASTPALDIKLARRESSDTSEKGESSPPLILNRLDSLNNAPIDDSEIPHKLHLAVAYGNTTLSASDLNTPTSATIYSKYDVRLTAGWKQEWTPIFATEAYGSLRKIDFEASTNNSKSITATDKNATLLGLKAIHDVSNRLIIDYGVLYENKLFLQGMNTTTVAVNSVPVPDANAEFSFKAFEKGQTSIGFFGGGSYVFSASTDGYSIDSGYSYFGGVYFLKKYDTDSSVKLGLSYQDRSQNTSALRFHEQSVLGTLTFGLPLFKGGAK